MKLLSGSIVVALVLSSGFALGQEQTERKDQSSPAHDVSPKSEAMPKVDKQKPHPLTENQAEKSGEPNKLSQQQEGDKRLNTKGTESKSLEQRDRSEDPHATRTNANTETNKPALDKGATSSKAAAENVEKSGTAHRGEAQKPSDKGDQTAQGMSEKRKDSESSADARSSGSVSIDSQKQTRIQDSLRNQHVENIQHTDFDARVGVSVPDHYHFYPLPEEVVSIVPEYRGYDYIMADNEIIIVEPRTHKIVYTLQEGRSAAMDRRSVDCK